MASRPLGMTPAHLDARFPMRQNVAMRWMSSIAPASTAVKSGPPPPKVEAPPQAPVIATPTLAPVAAKQKSVSTGFQSARAVFEAKKATAVAAPSPPIRHRLAPHAAAAIVKQTSDLSSSSCSTVDSESDRKLEENTQAPYELENPLPTEAQKMKKEPVMAAGSVAVKAETDLVRRLPVSIRQGSWSDSPALMAMTPVQAKQPDIVYIDPLRLVLPVDAVPTLPDKVTCVYDNAAIEMQKSIKKVVRKLLKKNKARQEEFKANSRLFGTDFMDSHAYLDTLIKDFGAIRALQLVPCLLSIQPDVLKSNALLLTAKSYRLQHEEALEDELRAFQTSSARKSVKTDGVSTACTVSSPLKDSAAVKVLSPLKSANMVHSTDPQLREVVNLKANTTTVIPAPVAALVLKPSESIGPVKAALDVNNVIRSTEPMPEPHDTVLPVINVGVSAPTALVHAIGAVKTRADTETPSESENECQSLFGEPIIPATSKKQQQQISSDVPVSAASPVSSTHSFEEAESLFGERLSSPSRSCTRRRKTVTWGETKTVEVPVERASPVKKKPAPLIFGPATAGAFDSDSESELND